MAKKRRNRLPKLGRHSSGQARCTLGGRVYYCGRYGTLEAQRRYAELLAKWEANGRQPLDPTPDVTQAGKIVDVLRDYLAHVDGSGRYRKRGEPTSARRRLRVALDEFAEHVGNLPTAKLLGVHLLRWRDELERRVSLTRTGINLKVRMVRGAMKWARDRRVLTAQQWADIAELEPLRRHDLAGRDHKRSKRAVSTADIEAVASVASPVVARMLRTQAAIGCRPAEVCMMRWCDLSHETVDVDGVACRVYTVSHAKNEHHGGPPTVYCMPPTVLELLGNPTAPAAFVFRSTLGNPFTTAGYRSAVVDACARAGVEPFSPHQVRHGFLTRAARIYGVLAAAAAANHTDTKTTATYLHQDRLDGFRVVLGLAGEGGAS